MIPTRIRWPSRGRRSMASEVDDSSPTLTGAQGPSPGTRPRSSSPHDYTRSSYSHATGWVARPSAVGDRRLRQSCRGHAAGPDPGQEIGDPPAKEVEPAA